MNKKIFANRFGLLALLSTSLLASTAFAGPATQQPTQVVVTNSSAQPLPMIGLVTDADNPDRQRFHWDGPLSWSNGGNSVLKITTAPLNYRLIVDDISGYCQGPVTSIGFNAYNGAGVFKFHYLPTSLWTSGGGSSPVRFAVEPGWDLNFSMGVGNGQGTCYVAVEGHYVFTQTVAQ